jgi:hypothetical protein
MKHSKNLDFIVMCPVRHQIRSPTNHKLARAVDAARPSLFLRRYTP